MRILVLLIVLGCSTLLSAQSGSYLADLAALKTVLQKTPSFKAQIKGDKLEEFNRLYERLSQETITNPADIAWFYHLSQLFSLLQDNHLGFYQVPESSSVTTRSAIVTAVSSSLLEAHPSLSINIDSLKSTLANKSPDSIEGIYHYDVFYTVGLFKTGDKEYTGVVLDSNITLWRRGQIAMKLYEFKPNLYKAIYAHPLTKNFILFPIEKYQHQSLVYSYFYSSFSQGIYSKKLKYIDYVNLPVNAPDFEFRSISDKVQYVRIGTFQRNNVTSQQSKKLYDTLEHNLTAPNLVVDLRNQAGGAASETKRFEKLFKNYLKKGKIYLLVNNGTISQAEIFTLSLKKKKNVVVVGETTKGMLTYGSNYGKWETLPSGRFKVYPTDMKGSKELLQYEDYGITPDIILTDTADWIEQLLKII